MPELVDTTSSQTSVYIRQNVVETQREDEMREGEPETIYEYEECILTKAEYNQYLAETLSVENAALKETVATQQATIDDLQTQINEATDALVELAGMLEAE
jgi:hypothetical protein